MKKRDNRILSSILSSPPAKVPCLRKGPFVLYGAGELGKLAVDCLTYLGVEIECLIDKSARGERYGYKVYGANKLSRFKNHTILVTTISESFTEIKGYLKKNGCTDVVPFLDYMQNFQHKHPLNNGWFSGIIEGVERKEIEYVFDNLYDTTSSAHYLQFIAWRYARKDLYFDDAPITSDRYFIPEVKIGIRKDESFVDVGAYDGRVLNKFLSITGSEFSSALLIEPDRDNLLELRANVDKLDESIKKKIQILPVAISNVGGTNRFSHGFGFASKLNYVAEGNATCMTLDDVCTHPSFLKIHTEGEELRILKGGMNVINKSRPIIACTVYHNRDGLYTTQAYLMSNLKDYKFYFRIHNWCGGGGTIYAVPA